MEGNSSASGGSRPPAGPVPLAAISEALDEARRMAYRVAMASRLGELRGERVKTFDQRGLHPFSVECGRVLALEALVGDYLPPDRQMNPLTVLLSAYRDAEVAFRKENIAVARARLEQLSAKLDDTMRKKLEEVGLDGPAIDRVLEAAGSGYEVLNAMLDEAAKGEPDDNTPAT